HVMREEIHGAIGCNPKPYEQRPKRTAKLRAPGHEADSDCGEEKAEQVVQLEGAFARLVMALMQDPKKAMHNVFMRDPGHALHGKEHGEKNREVRKPIAHRRTRPIRWPQRLR